MHTILQALQIGSNCFRIGINKADFKVAREAAKRKKEFRRKVLLYAQKAGVYLPYPIGAIAAFFGLRTLYRFFKKRINALEDEEEDNDEKDVMSGFNDLKNEMGGKKQTEEIQAVAAQEPEVLAQIIEGWLNE